MSMGQWTQLLLLITISCVQSYTFDHYVYAQQWPTPFCSGSHSSKHVNGGCQFAPNITSWTNHGLWPSVNETYPNFCNNTWKLKESDFAEIEDTMRARWPSYGGTDWEFWKHEWEKHGTCAANVTYLHGPLKFFNYTLGLNTKYDLSSRLAKQLIVPSDTCYSYDDFFKATQIMFNETVILGCVWDKPNKIQHIAQIELCFDLKFNLNCDPDQIRRRRKALQVEANKSNFNSMKGIPEVQRCRSTQSICYFPIPH